ncbi:MAG: NADH-quinone oxidoreductase subunit NuoN [Rhodobiaceae bacterium]|nr:MAG: NADH-quinone oxidoreductase subunit NuoN [Rhodobiaceae bacterium]
MDTALAMPDLTPALAEIILAIGAMALLMLGVFRGEAATRAVSIGAVLLLIVAAFAVLSQPAERVLTFGGAFVMDGFAIVMKCLVLLGSAVAIVMAMGFMKRENLDRFEFPVLIVLATLGMLMMISANGLIALYMGLELQSLALYVVASFHRDSTRSTEAGLKYFVLGALSSGMLLYGSSLIYGFSGTTNFDVLSGVMATGGVSIGLLFGLIFLLAGLAFKVSAVPFHMWTPDVYEGAPTPVTAFFAAAPKIAAMALFLRVMHGAFSPAMAEWQQIVVFLSIASMVLGAFAAISQHNIKRMMAYSSIGHMGFALVGLASGTVDGVKGVVIYLTIYLIMNAGAFCCILAMRHKEGPVEEISDLAGLSRNQPMLAAAFAVLLFSLAGIPPLAGFFAKYYVFLAAIDAGLYTLAIIGVLASVVGAFYYLRIIKVMYFDEPAPAFAGPMGREMTAILTVSGLFTLLFILYPAPLLKMAEGAAISLVPAAVAEVMPEHATEAPAAH